MSEKRSAVKDERTELAKLEAQVARKRFEVESKENFGGFDYSVPAETEDTYTSYMSKRPDQGIVRDDFGYRDARTGNFASAEDYHKGIESQADYDNRLLAEHADNEKSYEDMSLMELAARFGEAEALGDPSTENEVLYFIEEKIGAYAKKYNWSDDTRQAHLDKLLDTAQNASEKKKAEIAVERVEKPLSEGEALAADILKTLKDNPEAATDDVLGRLREIQVGYLPDDEATRDQALAEYEARGGSAYDVDAGRVQDVDQAHDEAVEEAKGRVTDDERNAAHDEAVTEYEARTGAPYDVDAGRVVDIDEARNQAHTEYEARGGSAYDVDAGRVQDVDQAHDEAVEEAKGRVTDDERNAAHDEAVTEAQRRADYEADHPDAVSDIDAAHDEALAEEERRNRRWWRSPVSRLAGMLTVHSWSLRDRIENSNPRNRRIVAGVLGAVGLVGIALLVKNNIHTGGTGGAHHDAARGAVDAGQHGAGNHHNQQVELPTQQVSPVEFSNAAHHVNPGEGWLEQLDNMNVPKSEQPDLLTKILNSDDPGIKDWVYKMSDGNPGISHSGTMPQSVLESINALR